MNIPAQNEMNTGVESKIYPFSFKGNGGTLFGIQIVNLLLIIITLGIYYFWAKARVRSYTWSQADFDTNRFAYSGTGKEVLIGWLKVLVVFGIPFYVCATASVPIAAVLIAKGVSPGAAFVFLMTGPATNAAAIARAWAFGPI